MVAISAHSFISVAQFALELQTFLPALPVPHSTLSNRAYALLVQTTAQLATQQLSALLAKPDSFC